MIQVLNKRIDWNLLNRDTTKSLVGMLKLMKSTRQTKHPGIGSEFNLKREIFKILNTIKGMEY